MNNSLGGIPTLFLTSFSDHSQYCNHYREYLTPSELELVNRRATPKLQEEALISLALRRKILSKLLTVEPKTLNFQYSEHKKPFFPHEPPLHFNISHSGNFWVMLTDWEYPVGVDIEDTQRKVEFTTLAERFFTSREADLVKNAENTPAVFWHLWTGKEALLKAIGTGITEGLDKAEILRDKDGSYYIANEIFAAEWQLQWIPLNKGALIAIAQKKNTLPPAVIAAKFFHKLFVA